METQAGPVRRCIDWTRSGALAGRDRVQHLLRETEFQRHVVHHGSRITRHALQESGLATTNKKTGKLKVRKLGLVSAVVRPTRTLRKATSGALLVTYLETMVRERANSGRSHQG